MNEQPAIKTLEEAYHVLNTLKPNTPREQHVKDLIEFLLILAGNQNIQNQQLTNLGIAAFNAH